MRKKLAKLALVMAVTAAALLSTPYNAEAACNPRCCGINDCSCCTLSCLCPSPALAGK